MSQEVVGYQEHPSFTELVPKIKEYVELKGGGLGYCGFSPR